MSQYQPTFNKIVSQNMLSSEELYTMGCPQYKHYVCDVNSILYICLNHAKPSQYLESSLPQILSPILLLKRHIRLDKVHSLQRILRRLWQTLISNQRLGSTSLICETALVVHRPDTVILDQRMCFLKRVAIRRAIPFAMAGRTHGQDVVRGCLGRVGDPNDHSLPIVAVSHAGRGLVLGEIPRVHEGVLVTGLPAPDVDLSVTLGAVAVVGARDVETAAICT